MTPLSGWLTCIFIFILTLCTDGKPAWKSSMSDLECPEPYLNIWGQCLFISKNLNYNFNASQKFCRGLGGELAELKNPQVLRVMLIDDRLPLFKYPVPAKERREPPPAMFYLVGATYNEEESLWYWENSGNQVNADDISWGEISSEWGPWGRFQPEGESPYCLYLDDSSDTYDGAEPFVKAKCSRYHKFVCELTI